MAHSLKSPRLPEVFGKAFLKGKWRGVGVARYMISLCTILWLADGEAAGWCHSGSDYESLGSRRPGAMCLWSSSSSSIWWWGGRWFTSAKELRKFASNTIIWELEGIAKAEDKGEGLSWVGPAGSCYYTLSWPQVSDLPLVLSSLWESGGWTEEMDYLGGPP